jgi:hypothetical protein
MGIPGRWIVVPFAIGLVVCLVIGLPSTLRFAAAQDELDNVRQRWPAASVELGRYYDQVASELGPVPETAAGQEFVRVFDAFSETVLYTEQLPLAIEIQQLLPSLGAVPSIDATVKTGGVSQYLEAEEKLAATRRGLIGRITYRTLRLPELPLLSENI